MTDNVKTLVGLQKCSTCYLKRDCHNLIIFKVIKYLRRTLT